jgi:cytochrome c-type biogenesis protein CcmE
MTRKQRRLTMLVAGLSCGGVAVALMLNAFKDNIVFFYSPTELGQKHPEPGQPLRIGGLVELRSVVRQPDNSITFKVTDGKYDVSVGYRGILPDLFREGQGVVAEGTLDTTGRFQAATILAKHDEKYMPPEVAAALKKSGQWHGDEAASAKAAPALDPGALAAAGGKAQPAL